MDRRQVLVRIGSVLLALPASRVLGGCGGGGGGGNGGIDAGQDAGGEQRLTFTSSSEQAHTHTFTIERSAIADSPSAGVGGETTLDAGHLHSVALTEAELDSIEAGGTVTKTTSLVSGHTHSFDFKLS